MMKLFLVLLIALVGYSLLFFFSDEVISPDDLVYDFFSSHLAATGRLGYRPPGDGIFGEDGFTPRYFVYHQNGETFPRKFPGFIIFWAGLKRVLPHQASRLVNPLCAVISLLFLFLIGKETFPSAKTPIRAVILLATTPVFLRRAYAYNADLFNLAVFLAALCFLLRALRYRGFGAYLLFGVFAGALIWIRPTNAVYLTTFLLLLLIERRKVSGKFLIVSAVIIALFGGGLLIYNKLIYGGYFNLSYTATHIPNETEITTKVPLSIRRIIDYLNFHPRIWILHLKNAPLSLTLACPLLVLALVGFFIPRREKPDPAGGRSDFDQDQNPGEAPGGAGDYRPVRFNLYYFWLFVISVCFFSNFATFGHELGEYTINSSFLRYLMPAICLLPLFAARVLSRFSYPSVRLLTVLAGFNLTVALIGPGGSIETVMQSRYYRECRRFLLDNTDQRTVFFTYYWDKLVFPERMVYTHGTQFPADTIGEAIRRVEQRDYRVAYPASQTDPLVETFILDNYEVAAVTGPVQLSPLSRLGAAFIPGHLYPLKLYLVTGRKGEVISNW
ncbi:MAG: glycosyltransferase family 39 protein [PVC group bacterium]